MLIPSGAAVDFRVTVKPFVLHRHFVALLVLRRFTFPPEQPQLRLLLSLLVTDKPQLLDTDQKKLNERLGQHLKQGKIGQHLSVWSRLCQLLTKYYICLELMTGRIMGPEPPDSV